jgi:hypothetical protein
VTVINGILPDVRQVAKVLLLIGNLSNSVSVSINSASLGGALSRIEMFFIAQICNRRRVLASAKCNYFFTPLQHAELHKLVSFWYHIP